jgi:uncharacterized protein with NRDE domain
MCVVAVAWNAHPDWKLVVAGNRDEYHARTSAALARWDDLPQIIAGRDLVSGGTWMGVSEVGRFAVVTNIRDADGPDPEKISRGALAVDWLRHGALPDDGGLFNPFNLLVSDRDGMMLLSNRPTHAVHPLATGIHGLSNAIPNEHWPRKDRLVQAMMSWTVDSSDNPDQLLELLGDENLPDRDAHPLFIRSPVYGTRCSTVIAVDRDGGGQIIERLFDSDGYNTGQTCIKFRWSM